MEITDIRVWTFLAWAVLNPWTAVALGAVAVIFLGWIVAVRLSWMLEAKMMSVSIALFGVAVIVLAGLSYTAYRSWAEPKPDVQMLGR
jgi:hypothetical protein